MAFFLTENVLAWEPLLVEYGTAPPFAFLVSEDANLRYDAARSVFWTRAHLQLTASLGYLPPRILKRSEYLNCIHIRLLVVHEVVPNFFFSAQSQPCLSLTVPSKKAYEPAKVAGPCVPFPPTLAPARPAVLMTPFPTHPLGRLKRNERTNERASFHLVSCLCTTAWPSTGAARVRQTAPRWPGRSKPRPPGKTE